MSGVWAARLRAGDVRSAVMGVCGITTRDEGIVSGGFLGRRAEWSNTVVSCYDPGASRDAELVDAAA
jgi:hypothetical protein